MVIAQQGRGTLRGVTKDELGASIVGATVTLSVQWSTTELPDQMVME